jgi:SAM-dependent methyltransferase
MGYKFFVGYDLDPHQVQIARSLDLPAQEGDAFRVLEGDTEGLDLISSLDFVEHLSKDNALRFIALCHDHLRPAGVLILRTPCADGPFSGRDAWNDLTHRWTMTSNVLRVILEMHGFERIAILDERPQPSNFVNCLRYLAFFPTRVGASLLCHLLGVLPPAIWSSSMWGVAYKHSKR